MSKCFQAVLNFLAVFCVLLEFSEFSGRFFAFFQDFLVLSDILGFLMAFFGLFVIFRVVWFLCEDISYIIFYRF